jgi:hypothetical protein
VSFNAKNMKVRSFVSFRTVSGKIHPTNSLNIYKIGQVLKIYSEYTLIFIHNTIFAYFSVVIFSLLFEEDTNVPLMEG